jgi:hypothetical protein
MWKASVFSIIGNGSDQIDMLSLKYGLYYYIERFKDISRIQDTVFVFMNNKLQALRSICWYDKETGGQKLLKIY